MDSSSKYIKDSSPSCPNRNGIYSTTIGLAVCERVSTCEIELRKANGSVCVCIFSTS